jgi:hypothetical protein
MRPADIQEHLRRWPFQPLRVHLSDGSAYDIRHPEMAYVSRTELVIGISAGDSRLPARSVYCDPVHVTRIEPIDGQPADAA